MNERDEASYQDHLEAEIAKRDAVIKDLRAEIEKLKREKGISSVREGLTFNSRTGLWADPSGLQHCPQCLDKEKRNPLKEENYGWRCTACTSYFSNPDRRPPRQAAF